MIDIVVDGSLLLAIPIAFLAGLASFLSPCVLPLAPGYLAYVAGMTGSDLRQREQAPAPQVSVGAGGGAAGPPQRQPPQQAPPEHAPTQPVAASRSRVVLGAVLFVLGFTAVFVSYGLLFGGIGGFLLEHQRVISIALGAVVVVLGLGFLGLPALSNTMWWNRQRRVSGRPPTGLWGAPLLGVVFGLGWTPCIGPTLAAVQSLAFTEASAARGAVLSAAYCVGLGLPFVLIAWGLRWSAGALAWTRRHNRGITIAGGTMLIVVGVLLMTGWWNDIVAWLQALMPGFTVPV